MKNLIRRWLGIESLDNKLTHLKKIVNKQGKKNSSFDGRIKGLHTLLNNLHKKKK